MASVLEDVEGFEWDEGNSGKNRSLHRGTDAECEEVFSNAPLVIVRSSVHSDLELRFAARGVTNSGRRLIVIFTTRKALIRVISARDVTRREDRIYEEKIKRDS